VVAILAVAFTCGVCGFFLYVLVQFRRDEKHPRRSDESLAGFPMAASGQIVRPLVGPGEQRNGKAAPQEGTRGGSKTRGAS
jgi:hypothetical protein